MLCKQRALTPVRICRARGARPPWGAGPSWGSRGLGPLGLPVRSLLGWPKGCLSLSLPKKCFASVGKGCWAWSRGPVRDGARVLVAAGHRLPGSGGSWVSAPPAPWGARPWGPAAFSSVSPESCPALGFENLPNGLSGPEAEFAPKERSRCPLAARFWKFWGSCVDVNAGDDLERAPEGMGGGVGGPGARVAAGGRWGQCVHLWGSAALGPDGEHCNQPRTL